MPNGVAENGNKVFKIFMWIASVTVASLIGAFVNHENRLDAVENNNTRLQAIIEVYIPEINRRLGVIEREIRENPRNRSNAGR